MIGKGLVTTDEEDFIFTLLQLYRFGKSSVGSHTDSLAVHLQLLLGVSGSGEHHTFGYGGKLGIHRVGNGQGNRRLGLGRRGGLLGFHPGAFRGVGGLIATPKGRSHKHRRHQQNAQYGNQNDKQLVGANTLSASSAFHLFHNSLLCQNISYILSREGDEVKLFVVNKRVRPQNRTHPKIFYSLSRLPATTRIF